MAIAITPSTDFQAKTGPAKPGFFRRMLDRFIAARELEARRYVNAYLVTLDDETLAKLGYDRSEIQENTVRMFPY